MNRPRFAHWIKYHWLIIRWLPFGKRLWRWADNQMDQYYEARDGVVEVAIGKAEGKT